MSVLFLHLVGCFLRVSVVAAAALGCVAFAGRRRPAARACIAATALIAILLLTAFDAIPMPAGIGWSIPANFTVDATTGNESNGSLTDQESAAQASIVGEEKPKTVQSGLSLADFARRFRSLETRAGFDPLDVSQWFVVLMIFIGITLGSVSLAWSLASTLRLERNSHALGDPEVHVLFSEILRGIERVIPIALRESSALDSAATIGWLRPMILLPVEWREWSRDELRAVLAHEVAHIIRRDFVTRFASLLTQVIHFYHPLVRMLAKQLVLNQELAADEWAAPIAGGTRAYLYALSRLALRNDDRSRSASAARLLPVFSSFLIRRIEMLQGTERQGHRSAGTFAWTSGVFVVALAIATAGFREASSLAVAEEAKNVAETQPAKTGSSSLPGPSFAREMIDPSAVVLPGLPADLQYARGAFAIRVAELLKRPEIFRRRADIERVWHDLWKESFETDAAPSLSIDDVIDVIGNLHLEFSVLDAQANAPVGQDNNRLQLGSNLIHVRMRKPVELESLKQALPKATSDSYNGVSFLNVPTPAFGPLPTCLFTADEKTLVIAFGVQTAHTAIDAAKQPAKTPIWIPHWKEVDGGLFTLLAPSPAASLVTEIDPTAIDDFPQFFKLLDASPCVAFGADWADISDFARLKMHLALSDETPVRPALELIERMLFKYRHSIGDEEARKDVVFQRTAEFLKSLVVSVSDDASRNARGISAHGSVQLPLETFFVPTPDDAVDSMPDK